MKQDALVNHLQNDDNELRLFSEFPIPSYEQWREVTEKSLKGASFETKLMTNTYEEFTLQPIYRKEDIERLLHVSNFPGFAPYVRGTKALGYVIRPWEVCQEISPGTPEEFNRAAQNDLQRGQTMLNLVLDRAALSGLNPDEAKPEDVGNKGVSIFRREDLDTALDDINLEKVPLYIQTGALGLPILALLLSHLEAQGKDPQKLSGCIGMNPLGALVQEGTIPCPLETAYDAMEQITNWAIRNAPQLQTILVEGHPYHNAGGSAVQELAFSLATAVEYIRALLNRGSSIEEIASKIRFSFSIGSNFFMEIAKVRAARMLWANIVRAFGGSDEVQKMTIHARTSAWTKTIHDPYVNMLRSTTEAFAAIVGGVDSLHVSPFDEAIRTADEFSRRIARNTQFILEQEANLSRVVDPAGGSWYVESLTDSIAQKAWELFQQVEDKGGMLKALQSGYPQDQIEQVAAKRRENIARRKDRLVGTNMYPNLQEPSLHVEKRGSTYKERAAAVESHQKSYNRGPIEEALQELKASSDQLVEKALKAALAGASLGELTKVIVHSNKERIEVKPVHIHRGAEPFEFLRTQAELYKNRTGSRPKVFLVSMGPISKHKPRADFCTGFFEVGGFEVLQNHGFPTIDEAAQAALASGASIVVICSDDESYPEIVPSLSRSIQRGNPEITVLLAGNPADNDADKYKQAGVDDFIHVRTNCYEMLLNLQRKKGIVS
ncbi:methylmalonyl-CoA mutase family protein [Effusibacillus consociatus]|uniref:methylmalonyl-CoA mutase n=2 Tax=Effusibacillus consociatus TaxID=1117041 RepID=A0ABV9QAP2_9BACL